MGRATVCRRVKAPDNFDEYLCYEKQLNALHKCADPYLLTMEEDTVRTLSLISSTVCGRNCAS